MQYSFETAFNNSDTKLSIISGGSKNPSKISTIFYYFIKLPNQFQELIKPSFKI